LADGCVKAASKIKSMRHPALLRLVLYCSSLSRLRLPFWFLVVIGAVLPFIASDLTLRIVATGTKTGPSRKG